MESLPRPTPHPEYGLEGLRIAQGVHRNHGVLTLLHHPNTYNADRYKLTQKRPSLPSHQEALNEVSYLN